MTIVPVVTELITYGRPVNVMLATPVTGDRLETQPPMVQAVTAAVVKEIVELSHVMPVALASDGLKTAFVPGSRMRVGSAAAAGLAPSTAMTAAASSPMRHLRITLSPRGAEVGHLD